MDYEEDEYWGSDYTKKRTSKRKQLAPPGVHVPNKNEGKLLRKLMSETGLNEEELRQHKTYRVQLSEAQKVKPGKTKNEKTALRILKRITGELKLPKEHPDVVEEYMKRCLKEQKTNFYFSHYSPKNVFNIKK